MADVDTTNKATTTVATNVQREEEGAKKRDLTAAAATAATFPFFRLPRELRDEIYDRVACSARTTFYEITLEANKPPRKIAYITRGGSQFEVECADAASRRIKSLLVAGDRSGRSLCGPETSEARDPEQQVKAKHHWLEGSQGYRADGSYGQHIHALILVLPLASEERGYRSMVVIRFRFPGKEELGPRRRFDAYWYRKSYKLKFPALAGSAVQELLDIARQVVWKGSIREYMIWRRYVANYVRRETC